MMYALLVVAIVAGLFGAWYDRYHDTKITDPEPTAIMCTMDARQCPDGTYVGRSGPDCEFVCPELPHPTADAEVQVNTQ
jgi:hypothetical protein